MKLPFLQKKSSPPALFQADFYGTQTQLIDESQDPWIHYCEVGFKSGLDPNPLFSTRFYQDRYLDRNVDKNPLLHYLRHSEETPDTHPLFDGRCYLAQIGKLAGGQSALEHFLEHNAEDLASPCVFFDTRQYLQTNPEVKPSGLVALYHYVRFGQVQGRDLFIDHDCLNEVLKRDEQPTYPWLIDHHQSEVRFLASILGMDARRPFVVLSCNSARFSYTHTVTKISALLRDDYGLNTIHIFGSDETAADQFSAFGPTVCLATDDRLSEHQEDYRLECLAAVVRSVAPVGALFLDQQAGRMVSWLEHLSIPIQAIVPRLDQHDLQETLSTLQKSCQTISLPASLAHQMPQSKATRDCASVRLVDTEFDSIEESAGIADSMPSNSAVSKRQLGLPTDKLLIVASGSLDLASGFDRFISIASCVLAEPCHRPVQFLWFGPLDGRAPETPTLVKELNDAQVGDGVLITEDEGQAADLLRAADVLLLTHREPSRSTSINDYLAAEKPVVWFRSNTAVERLMNGDPCGVEPTRMPQAVAHLQALASDEEYRHQLCAANRKRRERLISVDELVYQLSDLLVQQAVHRTPERIDGEPRQTGLRLPATFHGSQRKRVVFTAPSWEISGVNTFIETLVQELNELGYEAFVLFTTNQPLRNPSLLPAVPYRILTHESGLTPMRRRELLRSFLSAMAPCVFVPNYDYVASTVTPELPGNVATLGVLHSDDPQHYVHGYRMGPYWDAIVSVSQRIHENLMTLNPAFEKKSRVIRYGIREAGCAIEPRHVTTPEQLRIVYTGRIVHHQKRIFDFQSVAERLNDHRDQFHMTFVGDGPDLAEFQSRMAPHIAAGWVQVLGRQRADEIHNLLLGSHVFALTSEFEGLPLSLLEALSVGLVPAVTHVPSGIGEVLTHEKNALLSPIAEPRALAENLIRLADSRELFNRLSDAARTTLIEHKLTARDMAAQYAAVLDELFEGRCQSNASRAEQLIFCPNIERLLNVA